MELTCSFRSVGRYCDERAPRVQTAITVTCSRLRFGLECDACSAVVKKPPLKVRASYLEVYEDRIFDLLDVSNRDKPVEDWATVTPVDDGEGNQVLKGLTTFEVDNEGEKIRPQSKKLTRKLTDMLSTMAIESRDWV